MANSNLCLKSNLMLVERVPKYEEYRFLPGDYISQAYPEYTDRRLINRYLSPEQIHEYEQIIVCIHCKKACAGTCVNEDT